MQKPRRDPRVREYRTRKLAQASTSFLSHWIASLRRLSGTHFSLCVLVACVFRTEMSSRCVNPLKAATMSSCFVPE